ncbi:unnamed protein product [Onchocerca flexuosa]|uniref:Crp/Fnr family transcriptional regulator n=1 Tax=Onchocerca flexuosa TaxID=387005 RepID=A0A183HXH4_9BILA|nr:unnamed protein product [Onchocerca flexuosa]
MSHFSSVSEVSQIDVLDNVPKSLIIDAPQFAFQELKKEDRETLLVRTGRI